MRRGGGTRANHVTLGNVRQLLLARLIAELPREARIAICGAGKFLGQIWPELRPLLDGRRVVAVLDDAPDKLALGAFENIPIRPLAWATRASVDAALIASEHAEAWLLDRLAPLGVPLIRTAHVGGNPGVTPAMLEAVLADPALDLLARPAPWKEPLMRVPLHAGLEITTGCNLNCVMCETHSASKEQGMMSLALFERMLDELEAIGSRFLTLHTIGEPTIHRQFADILRISHERGFDVWLSTNGQLLDRFLDALIRWPVRVIRWSVDGATAEVYERIRVNGRFGKLLLNMQRMQDAIETHRLPTRMEMNVTLSAENLHEAPLFYEVYGRYFGDRIHFSILASLNAGDLRYYERNKLLDAPLQVPCAPLWDSMYVGFNGQVSACCRDYHGELIVGDATRQSLEEIWKGEAFARLRAAHAAGDVAALPRACRTCYCAETGQTELLSAMIGALQRERPRPGRAEFASRLRDFARRLNPCVAEDAPGVRRRLPVLSLLPV